MRKSAVETAKKRRAAMILCGALACLGAVFLCTLLFSAVMSLTDVSEGMMSVMSGTALSAGCFAAAYTVSRRRGRNGLFTGFACGGIVFAAALLLGIIFVRSFSAGGTLAKLLMILSCSGIGGIIGVNSKSARR